MKGLEGMIRLGKWRLDEARRDLAAAEIALAGIDRAIAEVERSLAAEQEKARTDPFAAAAYGPYAFAALARRRELSAARAKAVETCGTRREAVAEAFRELKKFEILARRRREEQDTERKRREQSVLDEIGLDRHMRAQE